MFHCGFKTRLPYMKTGMGLCNHMESTATKIYRSEGVYIYIHGKNVKN
jgi:hypothetical protein